MDRRGVKANAGHVSLDPVEGSCRRSRDAAGSHRRCRLSGNKAVIYDLLFKVSAETMLTIAALSPPPTASIFPIEQVSPTRLVSWSDLPENNLPIGVNCFRRVDLWDDTGDSIVERVAGVDDFEVAEAPTGQKH
jgi:hypothetical protein